MQDFRQQQKIIFLIIFAGIISVLIIRLFYLQIIEDEKYGQLSRDNSTRIIPSPAPRGIIYDRHYKILATNSPNFSLYSIPQDPRTLKNIFQSKAYSFEPFLVKEKVSLKEAIIISETYPNIQSIRLSTSPKRFYPHTKIASHILGFIGEIAKEDLEKLEHFGYKKGDILGKSGLEGEYDLYLRGINGGEPIEVDVLGRPIRSLGYVDPTSGDNIILTLDLDLQRIAEEALGEKRGTVILSDPRSGEILALASHPNYDPNQFALGMTKAMWQRYQGKDFPLLNRAMTVYPPGSIFKVITAAAALENNLVSMQEYFYCPGYFKIGQRVASCWEKKGHGRIDFLTAIAKSCDVVFYNLGLRIKEANLKKYARKFNLGKKTNIDLLHLEAEGLVPDAHWKRRVFNEYWYPGDTINYAVGQGFLQVSSLQMLNVISAFANEGEYYSAHLLKKVVNINNDLIYLNLLRSNKIENISKQTFSIIKKGLRKAVTEGTGKAADIEGLEVCGKTGTSEHKGKKPHAWFVGFAPQNNPQIAIVVFVEHGGMGGAVAAPIAGKILKWWKDNRFSVERGAYSVEEKGSYYTLNAIPARRQARR